MNIIGNVEGRFCILIDDIVDSGGTLCNAAQALKNAGAVDVVSYVTHGVLSGGAVARITASKINELVLTDTIQPTEAVRVAKNIRVISVGSLLGEAIKQGGTTLRDYVNADGMPGYFRLELFVYERDGQPCRRCGTPIRKLAQGQRSTYFCPACQK
jgi:hypothetical protein